MSKIVAILQSWGPLGAVFLAVLDSSGVPLPASVDIMILIVSASNPALAYLTAALSIIGSAIGSMILYSIARKGGQLYLDRHTASPRAHKFREWFSQYGMVTVFIPTLVPIIPLPLKVFVLSAGALGVRPLTFLLTILAARLPRYFGLAYLGSQLGQNSVAWLNAHKWHFGAGAAVLFVLLFALVKISGQRHARMAGTH